MGALATRFWAQVRVGAGCWEWQGYRVPKGYGRISTTTPRRDIRTHRLSWELHFGPVPAGLNVLHRCDNPPCVRPTHLFLGTTADNNADMRAKGRFSRRLTEDVVRAIRRRHADGAGYRSLARTYGVGRTTVKDLLQGKTWRAVP